MRTSNPALNENVFAEARSYSGTDAMTIQGTVKKSFILLFILSLAAFYVWQKIFLPGGGVFAESRQLAAMLVLGGAIAGFVVALVTTFLKRFSPVTAPLYAVCEGFVLGGMSAFFEVMYRGIVFQAIALTFGTLFALLLAYRSGLIKASENFKLGIVAATGAIALFYFAEWILHFFGIRIPYIHEGGPIGIAFSLFIVAIAAFNLVLDFNFIEQGSQKGAPKYMEWYGAFGLMVTLVWLYLEILRLLSKARPRR